ncbi:MAG: PhnA protein, partial [Flavobacteriaceae bacterium]|nr:PhnA protein [Flavobacteriaceae bacterium]
MDILKKLQARSGSKCELCSSTENLNVYEVPPSSKGTLEDSILACNTCIDQIEDPEKVSVNHWRCLNDSMWSEVL